MKKTRLIFAGTPDFAVPSLRALVAAGYDICAVYTQPDRPAKRGQKLQFSAVKQVALDHALNVYQPKSLRCPDVQATLRDWQADALIVVAYGLLLPEAVLATPVHGCINVHGSLLPRWRGAAPIQRALEAGDTETGVTIMQMDKGMDTGAVYAMHSLPIMAQDTSGSLFSKLADLGASALIDTLPLILAKQLIAIPQEHALSTHAAKLTKAEAELTWTLEASLLARQIRSFNPWPGSTLTLNQHTIKIWQALAVANPNPSALPGTWLRLDQDGLLIACGTDALLITHMQFANHPTQAVSTIYRSGPLAELFKWQSCCF